MAKHNGDDGAELRLPRRLVLKSLAASVGFFEQACSSAATEEPVQQVHAVAHGEPIESPVRMENRKLGSAAWALSKPARAGEVEGYASACSASAGDRVDISVNVQRAQAVRWELFRVGHYGGLGGRSVLSGSVARVVPQPAPHADPNTGLLECAWPAAFSIPIDPDWLTGYYLLKLSNEEGFESYVPLVVCEPIPRAPLLMQASVTTWQAYNDWGGINLYINHLPDPSPFSGPRGYRVSFDRPYHPDRDIGFIEHSMARWLEQQGYDVAYITNLEVDRSPDLLDNRRLFMCVGHDEYWSLAERTTIRRKRDEGLSLAVFSGNTAYRRIRLDASSTGVERRVITCYKSAKADPIHDAPDTTADCQDSPYPQPENAIIGMVWSGWSRLEGFPFVVKQPDHWLFDGTGVKAGDSLGNVIGLEWDVVSNNGHSPDGLEVVAESPTLHEYAQLSTAHATVYYPTSTSFVFAAGSIIWSKGLSDAGIADARVQRVTQNVLARAGLHPEAPPVIVPPARPVEPVPAIRARLLAGTTGSAGNSDGPLGSNLLSGPSAIAAGPGGELYVCDAGNNRVRKISPSGELSTVRLADAKGRKLALNAPAGVAVDPRGRVYIANTYNDCILLLDEHGVTSVFAGKMHAHAIGDDPSPTEARFNQPHGLALDANGVLYVADYRNDMIRRIDPSGVTTLVRDAGGPTGLDVGPDGTVYYLATANGAIMSYSPSGELTTLANTQGGFGDREGAGAQAALRPCDGLVYTARGLIFSDTANNRIRKLAFDAENTVSTVLGTGRGGPGLGEGMQTELTLPRGVCTLGQGFAVADSASHRVLYFELPNEPLGAL